MKTNKVDTSSSISTNCLFLRLRKQKIIPYYFQFSKDNIWCKLVIDWSWFSICKRIGIVNRLPNNVDFSIRIGRQKNGDPVKIDHHPVNCCDCDLFDVFNKLLVGQDHYLFLRRPHTGRGVDRSLSLYWDRNLISNKLSFQQIALKISKQFLIGSFLVHVKSFANSPMESESWIDFARIWIDQSPV